MVAKWVKHFLRVRPRLVIATVLGLLSFFVLPFSASLLTRLLISWNCLAWIYLLLLWSLMVTSDRQRIRTVARAQDESASAVLLMVCLSSIASVLAIFYELSTVKHGDGFIQFQHVLLTFSTLFASWLLVPTAFATHYAHLFYLAPTEANTLVFPEQHAHTETSAAVTFEPHYWDFLYFSFTIAVASQTADVTVNSTRLRRLVMLQSVLSFVFNLSVFGLCINVTAGLM